MGDHRTVEEKSKEVAATLGSDEAQEALKEKT